LIFSDIYHEIELCDSFDTGLFDLCQVKYGLQSSPLR
jgi:hypothetical protein